MHMITTEIRCRMKVMGHRVQDSKFGSETGITSDLIQPMLKRRSKKSLYSGL